MKPTASPKAPTKEPTYPSATGQPVQVDADGRPIVEAVPRAPAAVIRAQVVPNNANIRRDAQGNALCTQCATPYPLPGGCTSWRCRSCGELNNASIRGNECSIL
ncbi:unnamed protein product [Hyaloperonospora brassicae]|uniref:Uncharacterized protein n=1 Tax=Hyaloperonospora brassicae TaxID=162125 RepID=A0AAV0THK9_HYABA|nr:unnamed protein product [Hyaloperonospora brassicae]